jgi:hypothetical protein
MRAQLSTLMSQVGSNMRLSQLHPLRPSHTDQSQCSISVETGQTEDGRKTKSTAEVGDPTGTPPKNQKTHMEKFAFINFENPLYISTFFGGKAGKEVGICC